MDGKLEENPNIEEINKNKTKTKEENEGLDIKEVNEKEKHYLYYYIEEIDEEINVIEKKRIKKMNKRMKKKKKRQFEKNKEIEYNILFYTNTMPYLPEGGEFIDTIHFRWDKNYHFMDKSYDYLPCFFKYINIKGCFLLKMIMKKANFIFLWKKMKLRK
jgi:hypothetical protein